MRNSKLILLFMKLILILLFIGCSEGETTTSNEASDEPKNDNEENQIDGGELHVALHGQPPTLDVMMQTVALTRDTGRLLFETLVTIDSNYEVVPLLAESFDVSDDNKIYQFHLRDDVKFHNGEVMTPEDVLASMNRWLELSPVAKNVLNGAVFEIEDENTVTLKLSQPSPLVLDLMASNNYIPAIMPEEVIESASPEGVNELIGTGPFKFEEWKQDQYIHFSKFTDYSAVDEESDGLSGKREALVDDIYFQIVTDASTRLAGLQTGEYDIATQLSYDDYNQLDSDPNMEPYAGMFGALNLLYNKEQGLAKDFKIREAINTALDLNEVMQGATATDESLYSLNSGFMDQDMVNWNSEEGSEFYNQNDPEKAKDLLEEAGYDGEELRILTSRDYANLYGAAVVIHEQLTQLGINATLEIYDAATFAEHREDPEAWDVLVMGTSPVSTPVELLLLNPTYPGGMDDPTIIDLLDSIETSDTQEEAKKLWDELQGYAWEEYLPFTKLGDYNHLYGLSNKVDGFEIFSGALYWNVKLND